MRFNTEAYAKLFPRVEDKEEPTESAIETFKPTSNSEPAIDDEGESEVEDGSDDNC